MYVLDDVRGVKYIDTRARDVLLSLPVENNRRVNMLVMKMCYWCFLNLEVDNSI